MTQPIGFNSSVNYTPHDPDLDHCSAEGAGGSGSHGGAEGAGGASSARPALQESQDCTTELVKTIAACGSAYLASRAFPPSTLMAALGCLANAAELVECTAASEPKASGQ